MSRLELARIPALTFYKDATTDYRRTSPLPQLVCQGKPCKLYTPDVVRCENLGGVGTEVDWKCEADLPESLRFGKVEVSCEGWSAPGDPYVLKGSCSLEYRLVQIPNVLRKTDSYIPRPLSLPDIDVLQLIFTILWVGVLLVIAWSFFKSCFGGNNSHSRQSQRPSDPRSGSSGWFPGGHDDHSGTGPPPPYSKTPSAPDAQAWRPGFWTGAALGGLGASLLNNRRQRVNPEPRAVPWDWEQEQRSRVPIFGGRRVSEDRGEGSSDLGAMRRSTGLGGSKVR